MDDIVLVKFIQSPGDQVRDRHCLRHVQLMVFDAVDQWTSRRFFSDQD